MLLVDVVAALHSQFKKLYRSKKISIPITPSRVIGILIYLHG
jgi:hypothetical protein